MHHIYTGGKGDPLCPLGFHPQVRWPTRCKRCFRDYKEHGGKGKDQEAPLKKDDATRSTPSLSSWSSSSSRSRDEGRASADQGGASKDSAFVNSTRLPTVNSSFSLGKSLSPSSSWTSTPDLGNVGDSVSTTVSVTLPRRRVTSDLSNSIDSSSKTTEFTVRRRTYTTDLSQVGLQNDSSPGDGPRSRNSDNSESKPKFKVSASTNTTTVVSKPPPKRSTREAKRGTSTGEGKPPGKLKKPEISHVDQEDRLNPDVEFIFRVKSSKEESGKKTIQAVRQTSSPSVPPQTGSSSGAEDFLEEEEDDVSVADTETTETTLVGKNDNELLEEVESLRNELEAMKTRCERAEREKSDILLRRLASLDTTSTKTAASEVLKLQQKLNDLSTQSEDLKDDNKSLSLKVRELEKELEEQKRSSESARKAEELQAKLAAAETLCEELMDENEDMKKELRELEDEIEEMQDNFREDQADEYSSLKKELEQTTKNCRILSFKLRKSERKAEQLEAEKLDAELKYKEVSEQKGVNSVDKIKKLEGDLKVANELATRLTKELEDANKRLKTIESKNDSSKTHPPSLDVPKPGEKMSRASLTRGGSQEDPQQLLRDLQDSLERETDLREQLRFAEEELSRTLIQQRLKKSKPRASLAASPEAVPPRRLPPASASPATVPRPRNEVSVQTDPRPSQTVSAQAEPPTETKCSQTPSLDSGDAKPKESISSQSLRRGGEPGECPEARPWGPAWGGINFQPFQSGPLTFGPLGSLVSPLATVFTSAANLRKKAARVEEDNDSLALQLKKMATKAKTSRRNSPSANVRTPKPAPERDEGVSDEEDPAELRLLLELNEQESAVLRKKVEELETSSEGHKKKIKELEEKLAAASTGRKFAGVGGLGSNASLLDKEKVKVAEQEATELRKKLIEKEREIERLESEVQLSHKRTRGHLIKSQSLDSPTEQKALDFKRQLQLVEQEAAVLRTKITTLEADNEKLGAENRKLQLSRSTKKAVSETGSEDKVSALESKLAESEKQVKELKEKLEKVEKSEEKKPSALPFGKMSEAERLKKELKAKAEEVDKLTKENKTVQETLKRLRDDAAVDVVEFYKSRKPKKPTDLTTKLQLKKMVDDLENEIGDVLAALKRAASGSRTRGDGSEDLEEEKKKLEKEREAWSAEKKALEAQIEGLVADKKNSALARDEISVFSKKLENAEKQLEEERANVKRLKKQAEDADKLQNEKLRLQKDVLEKTTTVAELEKKLADVDEKLKKTEKSLSLSRTKATKLEKNLEEVEGGKEKSEERSRTLQEELAEVRTTNASLKTKISDLEGELKKGKETIKNLEESIRREREKATDECIKAGSVEKKEITALREDLSKKSKQLEELVEKCDKLEKTMRAAEENSRKVEGELTKEKNSWKNKASDLETDLNAERKRAEQAKASHEKELKSREAELSALKAKMKASEASAKKMADVKDDWTTKFHKLEKELEAEKKKYEDLTSKYELLEEEHVVTKAQLVMEKEQAQSQVALDKKEMAALGAELKSLQQTLGDKQEAWAKEKKELQEKIRMASERAAKASEAKWELEKAKLRALNEEQTSLTEQLKQQNEAMVEQMEHMRKENEELRRKLDDFDKVAKIQRQISADSTQLEMQLREVRGKLAAEEKNHKSEMAALKLRYESRVNLISEELQASQNHLSRFKRERDTYKHMLEEAQLQMADLKRGGMRSSVGDVSPELKDGKTTVAALEQQISCMEDELSEARLECSKLKTEFVSEKSAWEVKLSELQSKVNELEEEKILSSGRTKVAGLRTKMELSWQKEREDQQRLLQETSTLARDLRQTLYEVERERDKERLESKRRQEQIKRTSEEEMEENRKKITELQCDLLELRDAHAKLRTTNEKLRREKEKWDKEHRALQRSRIRSEEEERKLHVLLDNIDLLQKATFEKKNSGKFLEPSSKKRAGSKSRESSPLTTPPDENSAQIQLILQRLNETAEDIRARRQEEERDEERSKRASSVGFRRAASTESDAISDSSATVRRPGQPPRKTTLHRKSLSLSETAGPGASNQAIWREEGNGGSLTSLEEGAGSRFKSIGFRENSMDSRLSGGSTQSEVVPGDKKKKKSLFGKLKKLTKSRSIEDPTSSQEDILRGGGESDSDVSTTGDHRGSKKDLKGKLAGMFKKDSSSRSNSLEQLKKSEERKTKTLPRNTSANASSTPPKSSTLGRPLDKARNPAASLLDRP